MIKVCRKMFKQYRNLVRQTLNESSRNKVLKPDSDR